MSPTICLAELARAATALGLHERATAGEGFLEQPPQTARIGGCYCKACHEHATQNLIPFLWCEGCLAGHMGAPGRLGCRAGSLRERRRARMQTEAWLNVGTETVKHAAGSNPDSGCASHGHRLGRSRRLPPGLARSSLTSPPENCLRVTKARTDAGTASVPTRFGEEPSLQTEQRKWRRPQDP
jgi:hypothetical protein